MHKKNSPVILTISLIIAAGFVLSGVSSFFSFQALFWKDIESVSELTSENIYVNINDLLDRPINVSIAMAHDTFLRDYMGEEPDGGLTGESLGPLQRYLAAYQQKYQFDSVFLVSAKTGAYYHYKNGIDRMMTPENPENEWYYDFLQGTTECSLNVDNDETKENVITVFVNCRLYDKDNNVLGIVGVGMETPYIQRFLGENEQDYGVHAYLIDAAGNIQLSSQLTEFEQVNLFADEAFAGMKNALDQSTEVPDQRWYHTSETDGYVITRFIPNLNWYLVVEKNTREFTDRMSAQFGISLLFLLVVLAVVIIITTWVLKKYDQRLNNLAEVDQLTGIRNRTSYERELAKYGTDLGRYQSFGIGVFDLNGLKATNDLYGHQVGDEYIKTFSAMLCRTFDHCPVFRIGGDEFAILFANLGEQEVLEHWEGLLGQFEELKKAGGHSISAAFGYAFWEPEELNTAEKIFKAADDRMYLSKEQRKHSDRGCTGFSAEK